MEKLCLKLKNCYGINFFEKEFIFSETNNSFIIYSPNGTMKTSLANTFQDFAKNEETKDKIFKHRTSERIIKKNSDEEINSDEVFVIEPYDKTYESTNMSTLLVRKDLKDEYDKIHFEIIKQKDNLLKGLKKISGINRGIEEVICADIVKKESSLYESLLQLQEKVNNETDENLQNVLYNKIFNEKVIDFLETKDFKEKLENYINIYDELFSNSTFFSKGIFDHYNAASVEKSLKDHKFFKANHSVYINQDNGKIEIKSERDFNNVIEQERNKILNDEKLKAAFTEIDKAFKNKELLEFRQYISNNQHLITRLKNLSELKLDLWVAYLSSNIDLYNQLMETYKTSKDRINKIIKEARIDSTKWQNVINIFNDRFYVPFKVTIDNEENAILGLSSPSIKFTFENNKEEQQVEKEILIDVLSRGEKRALYLLNIIFEIEARKEANQQTLLIIDDIADSFDYKNKYAIIEYLKEISTFSNFRQLILTHNFDFYRTTSSRLYIPRKNRLHSTKTSTDIIIKEEKYQNSVFEWWSKNLDNEQHLIAIIPFIRNLAEYCFGKGDDTYSKLTSLLHIKEETENIKIADLETIIKKVCCNTCNNITLDNPNNKIINLIYDTAEDIYQKREEILELEKKIVLSIAIRLKAEEYMIKKINDSSFVDSITSNQTNKLFEKYKELFPKNKEVLNRLQQVNLMTPENIHLNSFMYEPILDMSNEHLKCLYKNILELKNIEEVEEAHV